MNEKIELLKASVPFATILGVVVGAILNSRLGRADKIRDQLFSYRIKAYSELAKGILSLQKDIITLMNDRKYKVQRNNYTKTPEDILIQLNTIVSNDYLFLSGKTLSGIVKLELLLQDVFRNNLEGFEGYNDKKMEENFKKAYSECSNFIALLQDDLNIYRLDKTNVISTNVLICGSIFILSIIILVLR